MIMNDHIRQIFWFVIVLQSFVAVFGVPPIDTPSRCANARQPANGDVKCCLDTSGVPDELSSHSHSGGKSSGGSSKGPDVYTCSYSCDEGYKLNGPSVLECPIGLVTDNPTCTLVECNTLPTIDHGSLHCSNGFLYRSKCQYTCARGFNISGGSNILTCGNDGLWKGAVPMCQPVQCPPLAEPTHGALTCSNGRSFGADCRYTCDDRYVLDGSPILTCSESGQWIGKAPTCQLGECIPLPLLVHGSLTCTNGWDRRSRCFYSCHGGYSLTGGNFLLTCGSNGFWRGDIPTCEKGNSTTEFATYEMIDDYGNSPMKLNGQQPEAYSANTGGENSDIGTPAIVSIIAVAIILIAVGIGLFVVRMHVKRTGNGSYDQLNPPASNPT